MIPFPKHSQKSDISLENGGDKTIDHGEFNEKENGRQSLRELWWEFLSETTCHGFGKVGSMRRNRLRGILWMVFLIMSMSTIIWFLVDEVRSYYSYPYLSKTSLETFKRMPFPAVTICNMGSKNKSRSSKTEKDELYWLSISSMSVFSSKRVNWTDSYYEENGYFEPVSFEQELSMGMDVSKFILLSAFDFMGELEFEPILTSLGVCYTWNGDGKATTKMSGSLYNLHLILDINRELYEAGFTTSTGVKVIVHEPGTIADPINQGFIVAPGVSALASVSKKRVKVKVHSLKIEKKFTFLPYPFHAFVDDYCLDTMAPDFINKFHPLPYSVGACKKFCFAEKIFKRCGCVQVGDLGNHSICSKYQISTCYLKEMVKILYKDVKDDVSCDCPHPCEQTTYDVMVSTSQFPSDLFVKTLESHMNMSEERIRSNLLEINLFYDKLYYLWVRQIPKYERIGDVLASIGGQMGLFIGASVLTIMEFIEIIFLLLFFILKRLSSKHRNSLENADI